MAPAPAKHAGVGVTHSVLLRMDNFPAWIVSTGHALGVELGEHLLLCHHVHIQMALLHRAERCYVFAQPGNEVQVRSNALLEVGGSPTWTLTEDYALGMELKKYGWHCRYVQEYLAIGEAPDQIRNCYQQRSRWCKVRPPYLHSHAHASHR